MQQHLCEADVLLSNLQRIACHWHAQQVRDLPQENLQGVSCWTTTLTTRKLHQHTIQQDKHLVRTRKWPASCLSTRSR